jgi:hypothetical protein
VPFIVFVDRSTGARDRWRVPEFVAGALSGLLCTLVGFGFTIWWDKYKYRREVEGRDNAVIEVLRQEVSENLELAKQNEDMLADDFDFLKKSQTLVPPLVLLKVGAWDLIRVSIPRKIASDQRELLRIERMEQDAEEINNLIRSRESFRIFDSSASTLFSVIAIYDKKLQEEIVPFSKVAAEVRAELK